MASGGLLDICNRALLGVGARVQVSSVSPSDGSVEANSCSTLFTPTFESLARTANWNCLRKELTLSLIAAAVGTPENVSGTSLPLPPVPYLYAYSYPGDCLYLRYIVPSLPANTGVTPPPTTSSVGAGTCLPTGGQIPYQISTYQTSPSSSPVTVVLTNQCQATASYTVNLPNPAYWDSLFQAAMVASLGAFLVPALSLSLPLMDRCIKQAEECIAVARAMDGNEGVTTMDHLPDWMAARSGGQGYGYSYSGFFSNGAYCYSGMSWPGGWGGNYGD